MLNYLPSVVYLADYRTSEYLFLSKNVEQMLGYTRREIMSRGQIWHIKNNIHPEDLAVFSSDVFTRFMDYTRTFSIPEIKKLRFSVNLRARRKDGVYIQALQQSVVLECDEDKNPILVLGTWADITHHKTDNKVVYSVSRYDKKTGFSVITTDTFPKPALSISDRETQIIKCLAEGFSSKQIAGKLHISVHTVNAHRRNIMRKTCCKNAAQLSAYALSHNLA